MRGLMLTARTNVVPVLIGFHLVLDLLWVIVFEPYWLSDQAMAVFVGVCSGQAILIAALAGLGTNPAVLRLPAALLLTVLMWCNLLLGLKWTEAPPLSRHDITALGFALLFSVLLAFLPLICASYWFRFRRSAAAVGEAQGLQPRQFRIGHLLGGVFLLGMSLGLTRMVLPSDGPLAGPQDRVLVVLVPVGVVANVLIAMPCVWGAFASLRRQLAFVVAWPLFAIVISVLEVWVLIAALGPPAGGLNIYISFVMYNFTASLTVWLSLVALRLTGFRLSRGGTLPTSETPIAESVLV